MNIAFSRWAQTHKNLIFCVIAYLITGGILASLIFTPKAFPVDLTSLRIIILVLGFLGLTRYFGYMFLSPMYDVWHLRFRWRHQAAIAKYHPRVSVIIPAWNEEIGLLSTIKTVLKSTYTNLEIVVINDGSTDQSDSLMREFLAFYQVRKQAENLPIDINYRYIPNGGKGNALNLGVAIASGEIIVTIDADCLVKTNAIENMVRCFAEPSIMAAVGNVKIGNRHTLVGALQHLEYLISFYMKKADSLTNAIYIIGGAAAAYRRDVFDAIGDFSTTNITEDIDFSMRIQKVGMRIVYVADAIVYTEGASDLAGLIRQRTRWKRGRFQSFSDHREMFFSFDRRHNKILSWIVMPMALFGDIQLLFDIPFVAFLTLYGVLSHDFGPFILTIAIVATIFFTELIFGERNKKLSLYLVAPVGWLIFLATTYVEMRALFNSIWQSTYRKQTQWQQWSRQGVLKVNARQTVTGTFDAITQE